MQCCNRSLIAELKTTNSCFLKFIWWMYILSGGLTLIVGTQKWGFSCKIQRRPPADIFLNGSLPPKTPSGNHVHGHGSPVKIVEDFQSFVKNTKLWPSLWQSVSCKKMGLKSSHWSCLKAWFEGYTFCFTTILVRPSTGAQRSHERALRNVQMTLKD